jgi:hypothetical protein
MMSLNRLMRGALLLLSATLPYVSTPATPNPTLSASLFKKLVLDDFNRPELINNLGGESVTRQDGPEDSANRLEVSLSSGVKRGESGGALYLYYTFDKKSPAKSTYRMDLNDLDATEYDHLEFWVKGDPHRGFGQSFKVEFQRPMEGFPQLTQQGSYIVTGITDQWKKVRVPLNLMNGITKWTHIDSFNIEFHIRRSENLQGAYYIDDIALIKTGDAGAHTQDQVVPQKKREWEATIGGQQAAKKLIRARLVDWPSRLLIDKDELSQDNRQFLLRLARDTWRGLNAFTDYEHGLPVDTVKFGTGSIELEKSRIGDYTNITNVGIYLLSIVAATDFDFISKEQALEKLTKTLSTLERLEKHQGFYYNYYDTTTLERTSNFVSFVDSAWLTAGLMVVRSAFPELKIRSSALINQGNYAWLYDDVEQLMSHGYYVNLQYPSEYHYGLVYTESRMGSLIAIGKGDVPEEHWFKMVRTFPKEYSWQSLTPHARKTKIIHNTKVKGGYYEWSGLKFVPSWGGSLFEALMPTLVVDENKYAPKSLGLNDKIHAEIQRRYALEELKYPVWGMSPSSMTASDSYSEYGVKILGSRGYKCGVVTPHASALALNVTPEAAISNMRKLVELYDIYGEYGFYDAVDPISGKVAYKYLTLDQGMIFISLANYLRDNSVRKYFAADPIAKHALAIMGEERFFD